MGVDPAQTTSISSQDAELVRVPGWYADRFGFHQHPEGWPLNLARRAHERCRRAWVEGSHTWTCPTCGVIFEDQSAMKTHAVTTHIDGVEVPDEQS